MAHTNNNAPNSSRLALWSSCCKDALVLCAVLVVGLGVSAAIATPPPGTGDVGDALCEIPLAVLNTSLGRAIATIGVLTIGIMATLGRVTWTQALVVGVGISVIFGSISIVGMLATSGTDCSI